jgi:hypothetical protein
MVTAEHREPCDPRSCRRSTRRAAAAATDGLLTAKAPYKSDPMGSNMTPDILQAALEERYRLEARLRSNPDFRRLEAVRCIIALYAPAAEVPATVDPISCPEPAESTLRSAPMPNSDLSPRISSSDRLTSTDAPVSSRRGSWSYTNSQASRMRAAAAEYLGGPRAP